MPFARLKSTYQLLAKDRQRGTLNPTTSNPKARKAPLQEVHGSIRFVSVRPAAVSGQLVQRRFCSVRFAVLPSSCHGHGEVGAGSRVLGAGGWRQGQVAGAGGSRWVVGGGR